MIHFTEINQTPFPYSLLQDIGREATLKLEGGWFQNLCDVLQIKTFSNLNERKVRHGFKDGANSMCDCGSATEATFIVSAVSNNRTPQQYL